MLRFLLGLVLGLLLLPLGGWLYFRLGMAPVATADPLMPFEGWAARTALHTRINREMPHGEPIPVNRENLLAGAKLYREQCAICHGFRGQEQSDTAKGMFPKPPHLFRGKGVTDDEAGETYWKIANGIRLTGMPAYQRSLSNQQMWQLSVLLAHADKLPPDVETVVEGK